MSVGRDQMWAKHDIREIREHHSYRSSFATQTRFSASSDLCVVKSYCTTLYKEKMSNVWNPLGTSENRNNFHLGSSMLKFLINSLC